MRLLDAYLDKTITNEEYIAAKEKIINRKVEIKETDFGRKFITNCGPDFVKNSRLAGLNGSGT